MAQLDAAWMAASAGVSVVIASGKAKDGVLQVTAGVTLSANLMMQHTVRSSFHLFMHLASGVCVPFCLFLCRSVCFSACLLSVHLSAYQSVCVAWLSLSKVAVVLQAACTSQVKVDYKCSALRF